MVSLVWLEQLVSNVQYEPGEGTAAAICLKSTHVSELAEQSCSVTVHQRPGEMRSRTIRRPTEYDWLSCPQIPPTRPKWRSWAWPSVPKSAVATGDFFSPAGTSALVAFCFKSSVHVPYCTMATQKRVQKKSWWFYGFSSCFYLCRYDVLLFFWFSRPTLSALHICVTPALPRVNIVLTNGGKKIVTGTYFTLPLFLFLSFPPNSPERSSMIIKTGNASGCRLTGTRQEFRAKRTSTTISIKRKVPSANPPPWHLINVVSHSNYIFRTANFLHSLTLN